MADNPYWLTCPRCANAAAEQFSEHDAGPDGWDDDITYTKTECLQCGLWHSSWTDRWYLDQYEAEEYPTQEAR